MERLPEVVGLPLEEAEQRLAAGGAAVARIRRTGEVGRIRAERRQGREGLAEAGERVLQVRAASGGLELVVGPSFRRSAP
jgi:hypothetical protein